MQSNESCEYNKDALTILVVAQVVVTLLVVAWAVRLGSFLFLRVLHTGKDSRFDELKDDPGALPPTDIRSMFLLCSAPMLSSKELTRQLKVLVAPCSQVFRRLDWASGLGLGDAAAGVESERDGAEPPAALDRYSGWHYLGCRLHLRAYGGPAEAAVAKESCP